MIPIPSRSQFGRIPYRKGTLRAVLRVVTVPAPAPTRVAVAVKAAVNKAKPKAGLRGLLGDDDDGSELSDLEEVQAVQTAGELADLDDGDLADSLRGYDDSTLAGLASTMSDEPEAAMAGLGLLSGDSMLGNRLAYAVGEELDSRTGGGIFGLGDRAEEKGRAVTEAINSLNALRARNGHPPLQNTGATKAQWWNIYQTLRRRVNSGILALPNPIPKGWVPPKKKPAAKKPAQRPALVKSLNRSRGLVKPLVPTIQAFGPGIDRPMPALPALPPSVANPYPYDPLASYARPMPAVASSGERIGSGTIYADEAGGDGGFNSVSFNESPSFNSGGDGSRIGPSPIYAGEGGGEFTGGGESVEFDEYPVGVPVVMDDEGQLIETVTGEVIDPAFVESGPFLDSETGELRGLEPGMGSMFSKFLRRNKNTLGTIASVAGPIVGSAVPGVGTVIGGVVGQVASGAIAAATQPKGGGGGGGQPAGFAPPIGLPGAPVALKPKPKAKKIPPVYIAVGAMLAGLYFMGGKRR